MDSGVMEYTTAITGCGRRCPCQLWINCDYYTDQKHKAWRLSRKQYNFHEWYDEYFRDWFAMSGWMGNG